MNKNEFVGAVAAKANISQAAAKEAVDAALQVIAEALKDNNDVALVGFGTFKAKPPQEWASTPKPAKQSKSPQRRPLLSNPAKTCLKT